MAASTASSKSGFNAMLSFYRRTLDIVLRHQPITLGVFFATMALTVGHGDRDPEGLFPDPGHRHASQGFAEAAQETSPEGDDAADAQGRRRHSARSRRRRVSARQTGSTGSAQIGQYRPLFHRAQAARRAQAQRIADHRPPAAAARQGRGRQSVPAADPGHQCRRAHRPRQLSIHLAGHEYRRAERVVAEAPG